MGRKTLRSVPLYNKSRETGTEAGKMNNKKSKVIKTAAAAAAGLFVAGVLCSCAPLYGKVGEMMESAAGLGREKVAETREERNVGQWPFGGTRETAVAYSGPEDGEWDDEQDDMKPYEPFGVTLNESDGNYWFNGKPLAGLRDEGYNTMTCGIFAEVGAFVFVERNGNGNITRAYETDLKSFEDACGMTGLETSTEQRAEEMGYAFHRENGTVKDMDRKEFSVFETKLHAKYRNENAVVQVDDYVFWFDKNDQMELSSFCASSASRYGAKVYADYAIADEIDISRLDDEKTDQVIFDVLKANPESDKPGIGRQIKKAIAQAYGISENYITVEVDELG